jgi:integrase
MQTALLSTRQLAEIFKINERTISALVDHGVIPYVQNNYSDDVQFSAPAIAKWLQQGPVLPSIRNNTLYLQQHYAAQYPEAVGSLRSLDRQIAPSREPRLFYLSKVPNKRLGFVYYVRYREDGQTIPSRWSCGTNNHDLAELFARQNRQRLLERWRQKRLAETSFFARMERYYEEGSDYLRNDESRGRRLCDRNRRKSLSAVKSHWMPFIRQSKASAFHEVTPPLVARYQNSLLARGLAPQTVNKHTRLLSAMFSQFTLLGLSPSNPFKQTPPLRVDASAVAARGCHDIELLKGVFEEPWANETERLLCLLIYSTGMRNDEIKRATVSDVFERDGVHFISIVKSKTANGERIVPLHPFVLAQLGLPRPPEEPLVPLKGNKIFTSANKTLGAKLGLSEDRLAEERVTFYSGRHFYKTMLNSEDLGDVEEYFMGHRTAGDVSKTYNHRDKQGQRKLTEKALEVLAILDKRLFAS